MASLVGSSEWISRVCPSMRRVIPSGDQKGVSSPRPGTARLLGYGKDEAFPWVLRRLRVRRTCGLIHRDNSAPWVVPNSAWPVPSWGDFTAWILSIIRQQKNGFVHTPNRRPEGVPWEDRRDDAISTDSEDKREETAVDRAKQLGINSVKSIIFVWDPLNRSLISC